jgi:uncharacterized protein YceH (UPF0502 family)
MDERLECVGSAAGPVTVDFISGRVLGCLIEKAMTTPDHYPMSLNGVLVACNQVSNRDPVVEYDEQLVERTLRDLADRGLAKMVHRPGDRVVKYRQAVGDALTLSAAETALMAVLILRGPQTPGELRQRTTRYVGFDSLPALEQLLRTLQERTPALVERLDRRPGQKEYRYRQLFADAAGDGTSPAQSDATAVADEVEPVPAAAEPPTEDELADLRSRIEAIEQRLDGLLRELGIVASPGSDAEDAGDL